MATDALAEAAQGPFQNLAQRCRAEAGIESGQRPTAVQRKAVRRCIKQAYKAAYFSCASRYGVTLTAGQRPTGEQRRELKVKRQLIHSCLSKSGVNGKK